MAFCSHLLRLGTESKSFMVVRSIHTSSRCFVEQDWRYKNGLPRNPNAYGPLTDGKDFTFLDGRPTPIGVGQKKRIEKHKAFAEKIVQVVREMDFAVARTARIANEKEQHKRDILGSKLKPKGHLMLSNKK